MDSVGGHALEDLWSNQMHMNKTALIITVTVEKTVEKKDAHSGF